MLSAKWRLFGLGLNELIGWHVLLQQKLKPIHFLLQNSITDFLVTDFYWV